MKSLVLLLLICSCSKQQDYSYLNTDRRGCQKFVRISDRYTINWKYLTTIKSLNTEEHCGTNADTIKATRIVTRWDPAICPPPDASMPEFRIEVRYYEEVK